MKQSEIQPEQDTSSQYFDPRHKAYRVLQPTPSKYMIDESFPAECIEVEVERMLNNGEPIGGGTVTPQIFTDRMEGVKPEYDIRADHFELALDATDLAAKNQLQRRQDFHDKLKKDNQGNTAKGGDSPITP